ncbi:MAG: hypothetical protein RLZZ387_2869 [Chloroflexota bacterium]
MDVIYHLAPAARWQGWPQGAAYLPAEYEADGFVHCTGGVDLMLRVANTFYREVPGGFVLLAIDPARLSSELRWERPGDDLAPLFPHLYGPIDHEAIVGVSQATRAQDGTFLSQG